MVHADYCKQFIPWGGKVLDVGSGKGKFLSVMASLGFKAYGVEINSAYITESEARAQSEGVSIKVIQSRGEDLPFPDNYFDFVNCTEVTEHVDNPRKLCKEIFRVMKSTGKGYISFHNRFGIYDYHYHLYGINWLPRSLAERVLYILGRQKEDGVTGFQRLNTMHYYSYSRVKSMLLEIGFTVYDIREIKIKQQYGRFSFFLLFLYRILLRPLYFNSFHIFIER